MAKTVKFNLRFGDVPIRTVDDLREHFVMEDVLDNFDNGILLKFLQRRGYTEYAEKVAKLAERKAGTDVISRELVAVFEIDMDKETIDEYAEILKLRRDQKAAYTAYAQGHLREQEVIKKYFTDYEQIIASLIEHKNDLGKIKAFAKELLAKYQPILEKDWRSLYLTLQNNDAPYPVCHMLTKDFFRSRWLIGKRTAGRVPEDTKDLNVKLVNLLKNTHNTDKYPWVKKSNKASTYWDDIETADKTYLILALPTGAKIRATGNIKNEWGSIEVNDKFITLDGIQYRHNLKNTYLFYAEV